jgi:predicted HNH restriction endonuclease
MPDTVTKAEDLAMVCPNCHDIIHAKRPRITVLGVIKILPE